MYLRILVQVVAVFADPLQPRQDAAVVDAPALRVPLVLLGQPRRLQLLLQLEVTIQLVPQPVPQLVLKLVPDLVVVHLLLLLPGGEGGASLEEGRRDPLLVATVGQGGKDGQE